MINVIVIIVVILLSEEVRGDTEIDEVRSDGISTSELIYINLLRSSCYCCPQTFFK